MMCRADVHFILLMICLSPITINTKTMFNSEDLWFHAHSKDKNRITLLETISLDASFRYCL